MDKKQRYGAYDRPPAISPGNQYASFIQLFSVLTAELQKLPGLTEGTFLSAGSHLWEFRERAMKVSELSAQTAEFLSSGEAAAAKENLVGLLEELEKYVRNSEMGTVERARKFVKLNKTVTEIRKQADELIQISKGLRSLGLATMIYGAPIDGGRSGLTVFARNIKNLSDSMRSRAHATGTDIDTINSTLRKALSNLQDLTERQYHRMLSVLGDIKSTIKSLNERHYAASETLANLSDGSKEVSQSIEKVVMSAQFQDITSQKFENAKNSLDSMCERLMKTDGGGTDMISIENVSRFCQELSVLLSEAKEALSHALNDIATGMRDIASSVNEISDNTQKMAGNAEATGKYFLGRMSESLTSMKSALSEIFEAHIEAAKAAADAGSAVERTFSLLNDMQKMGDEVNLIAMNAAIRAAQNEKVSAFRVLARSYQRVSAHSDDITSSIASALQLVSGAVGDLSVDLEFELKETLEEARRVEKNMECLINTLEQLDRRIADLLQKMVNEARALSLEIAATIQLVGSGDEAAKLVGNVVSALENTSKENWEFSPIVAKFLNVTNRKPLTYVD